MPKSNGGWQNSAGARERVPTYASGALMRGLSLDRVVTAAGRLKEKGFREMKTQLALPGETTPAKEVDRIGLVLKGIRWQRSVPRRSPFRSGPVGRQSDATRRTPATRCGDGQSQASAARAPRATISPLRRQERYDLAPPHSTAPGASMARRALLPTVRTVVDFRRLCRRGRPELR